MDMNKLILIFFFHFRIKPAFTLFLLASIGFHGIKKKANDWIHNFCSSQERFKMSFESGLLQEDINKDIYGKNFKRGPKLKWISYLGVYRNREAITDNKIGPQKIVLLSVLLVSSFF